MIKFLRRIRQKWAYSLVGLWTAIREEKSLWAYFSIFPILLGLGLWVELSMFEWSFIVSVSFAVIAIELINTALEAAVDLISFEYNIKVKKIKDVAAGATLVISSGAFISILIIYIPKIIAMS